MAIRLHHIMATILLVTAACTRPATPRSATESFYFTGQVTDTNNAPAPGIQIFVQAVVLSSWSTQRSELGRAITDQDGRYKITPQKTTLFVGNDPSMCYYDVIAAKGYLYATKGFQNDTVLAKARPSFIVDLRLQ